MRHLTIVIERAQRNYSGFAPELQGCITTGKTVAETLSNMSEAISLHLETLDLIGVQDHTAPECLTDPSNGGTRS